MTKPSLETEFQMTLFSRQVENLTPCQMRQLLKDMHRTMLEKDKAFNEILKSQLFRGFND